MYKRKINFLFRLTVSIFLLVFVFTRVDLSNLAQRAQSINILMLVIAICLFSLVVIAWGIRWQLLLFHADISISLYETLRSLLIGFALSLFLPTTIGTDIGRAYDIAWSREEKITVISTVIMDRLIGLLTIVLMGFSAIAIVGYQYLDNSLLFPIVGVTLVFTFVWLSIFNYRFVKLFRSILTRPYFKRFGSSLYNLYATIYDLQKNRKLFMTTVSISIIKQVLEIIVVIILIFAIGLDIDPLYSFVFMPIILVILALPISIGGLGVRETAFVFFFTQVGMEANDAILLSLLYYMLFLIVGIVGGTIPIIQYIQTKFKYIS